MKLLGLLLLCSLAAAMVPRDRRSVKTEEALIVEEVICDPDTPCQWISYDPYSIRETIMPSRYCNCSRDTTCVFSNFDTATYSDVFRCRKPDPDETTTTEAN